MIEELYKIELVQEISNKIELIETEETMILETNGTTDHTQRSNKGENTHVEIDEHIADEGLHYDTVYDDTTIQAEVDLNTAKETNIAHPLVEKAVPSDALFTDTDTIFDDTAIQLEVALNTDKRSYPIVAENRLANTSGSNTGDQDLPVSGTDFDSVGTDNSDNNAINTLYDELVSFDSVSSARLENTSGTNTGDQDLPISGTDFDPVGTDNSDNNAINTLYDDLVSFDSASSARLANTSGSNTGDQDLSGYELLANKSTITTLGTSNTLYPTQQAVKTYVDNMAVVGGTLFNRVGITISPVEQGDEVEIASKIRGENIVVNDYIDFQPFGYNRFYVYDSSEFTTANTRMPFSGSFTSVKNWNARTDAIHSQFFNVKGDNYKFRIINYGYTFQLLIEEIDGTDVYEFTNTSSSYWYGKTDLIQFMAVDYEKGEIRFTNSDGDIFVFDSVELKSALELIKNETWHDVSLGINSYLSACKWSGIIKGVWDYDEKHLYMFDGGMNVPGGGLFAYKTGLLTNTTQDSFRISNLYNDFVDGSVTLDYTDIGASPIGTNKYTWFIGTTGSELDNELPSMNNYVLFKWRIKVNSGEFYWKGTTIRSLIRWFAKDRITGTEILLYNVGTTITQTIPEGDWDITQISYLSDNYGSSKGVFGFSYMGLSTDGSITVYDQLEIENAGILSWANPRQCTYEKCYDSFARQFTTTLKVSLGEE